MLRFFSEISLHHEDRTASCLGSKLGMKYSVRLSHTRMPDTSQPQKLFGEYINSTKPAIEKLPCHLPGEQSIVFVDVQYVQNVRFHFLGI